MSNERIEIGADGRKHITTEPRLNKSEDDTALLRQALDTLIWTTGSADFGEGGLAREGALRLLFPTISALRERLGDKT